MNERDGAPSGESRGVQEWVPSSDWDTLYQAMLDLPIHLRAVEGLPEYERAKFWKTLGLLRTGGGVIDLAGKGDMTLAGLGVYEALLTRSWVVRYVDPGEMVHLARVALQITETFDSEVYGKKRISDLRARAWGELANSFRAANRFQLSREAFDQALALAETGTGDPYLKIRLLDLEASLFGVTRDFKSALQKLTSLSEAYFQIGETHLAGRALITKALYTFYKGEPGEAIKINKEGLSLIERRRDSFLYMAAIHNHLLFLVDLGHFKQAERALFENRCNILYKEGAGALRFRWLEGRINYGLQRLVSAEVALREVKEGFARLGLMFPTGLAGLDLAAVLLQQERLDEAEAEARIAQGFFLLLEVPLELLSSVVFLEEAFRRRVATADLVEAAITHVRRKELQLLGKLR